MSTYARRRLTSGRLLVTITAAVSLTATGVGVLAVAPAAQAAASPYGITGIDIASWQHPNGAAINWSKVKGAGYDFAVVKATESTTYKNPYYKGDMAGARSVGLVVGSYHYARPALPLSTATAQARAFAATIGAQQLSKTLPPILDLEETGGLSKTNLNKWATEFLVTLRSATGRTPMIYSYDNFLRTKVGNLETLRGYPLWYANYTTAPTITRTLPGAWPQWTIWQHSSSATVPGISGRTDVNRFVGSYASLLAFASGQVPSKVSQSFAQPRESSYLTGRVDRTYAGEVMFRQSLVTTGKGKAKKSVWRNTASTRVRPDGTFSLQVNPTKVGKNSYRVFLSAASPYARVPGKPLAVTVVKPWVTVSANKSVKRNKTAHLKGRVDSFYAGEKVWRQKRTSSGKWVTVASRKVSRTGTFDFTIKPTARTTYSYRILLRATGPTAKATSRTVKVRAT